MFFVSTVLDRVRSLMLLVWYSLLHHCIRLFVHFIYFPKPVTVVRRVPEVRCHFQGILNAFKPSKKPRPPLGLPTRKTYEQDVFRRVLVKKMKVLLVEETGKRNAIFVGCNFSFMQKTSSSGPSTTLRLGSRQPC